MAAIASEQWSKGEEDEFNPQELIPNGLVAYTLVLRVKLASMMGVWVGV